MYYEYDEYDEYEDFGLTVRDSESEAYSWDKVRSQVEFAIGVEWLESNRSIEEEEAFYWDERRRRDAFFDELDDRRFKCTGSI